MSCMQKGDAKKQLEGKNSMQFIKYNKTLRNVIVLRNISQLLAKLIKLFKKASCRDENLLFTPQERQKVLQHFLFYFLSV